MVRRGTGAEDREMMVRRQCKAGKVSTEPMRSGEQRESQGQRWGVC